MRPMATRRHVSANYLTSAEAAAYLRFRGSSGIRAAVRRRELLPDRAGPRGVHLFTKETLDRFVRARAQSLGRLVLRAVPGVDHGKEDATSRHHGTGEEPIRDPGAGNLPAYRASKEVRRTEMALRVTGT